MSSPHEPTHVGPIAGGHLRVADADRDEAVALLDTARDSGRINPAEHAARVARARQAVVFDDLFPLTQDLQGERPSLLPTGVARTAPSTSVVRVEKPSGPSRTKTHVALFSGFGRPQTSLPARTNVWIAFGGGDLDLRQATFEDNVCYIDVVCMFGGLDVIVPEGVRVEDRTTAVFGDSTVKGLAVHDTPDEPTIVLRGFVAFGGVDVKGPERKSWKDHLGL